MVDEYDKQVYFRFLKENKLFHDENYIKLLDKVKYDDNDFICIFDKYVVWCLSKEGSIFWYKVQLDYIFFLITMNYNHNDVTKSTLVSKFGQYINGYSNFKCADLKWYKEYKYSSLLI